jgi:hypothetical protein
MSEYTFPKNMNPVKVMGKHHAECYACKNEAKGFWQTCWGPVAWGKHGGPITRTERRYGKTGRRSLYWLRYLCNDTKCPAELWIATDWILSHALLKGKP